MTVEDQGLGQVGVAGFSETLDRYGKLLRESSLPQVILFEGQASSGKRALLKKLAYLSFCESHSHCGTCASCLDIAGGTHTEMLWLDQPKYKVDDASRIQKHLSVKPQKKLGSEEVVPRIIFLVDIDLANPQFLNQLLKTFEEPFENCHFMATTSKSGQLLPTILSRAVRWKVNGPNQEELRAFLKPSATDEGEDWNSLFDKAYHRALGVPGLVVRYLKDDATESLSEVESLLRDLLMTNSFPKVLDSCEALVKTHKLNVDDLLRGLTLLLNEACREILNVPSRTRGETEKAMPIAISHRRLQRWRKRLAEIRQRAMREKIPLNLQMIAESFALD
ncbi:MAG: hypothetical protein HRU19_08975 [Pseudobacteriovorax sp.]|nr:hypothetical protein [Pseudobacteriovorax sp.]